MRVVTSFPILFLTLLPLLGIAQPGSPPGGNPDAVTVGTQFIVPGNPDTVVDGGGGQISDVWTNPDHARVQDDAYAFLTTDTKNKRTNYLLATNFGFAIPAGASILGIVVDIDRYANAPGGEVTDSRVSLIDATGTIGITDKSSLVPWPIIDLDNSQTYGGVIDTWGRSDWTSAKLNSPSFGVAIAAETSNDNITFNLFVDEIRVTVYYRAGGASRYAVASGLWSDPNSWSTTPGGMPGASAPNDPNDVFIGGGFTITYDASVNVNSLTIGTSESNPSGRLTFTGDDGLTVYQGGLVITPDGDILSNFDATLVVAGDITLNKVLTNRNLIISMDGGLFSTIILTGIGSIGELLLQSIVNHIGNVTITKALLGDEPLLLVNATDAHLIYSGPTNNLTTNVMDLSAADNTVEFSQTLLDAPDFNITRAGTTFSNLIISGNAPKYYNNDVTINGDLTITSSGILSNQSQQAITLLGNWTNFNGAAGFVPNSCTACRVKFSGSTDQTIANTTGEQFSRIEVAKVGRSVLIASGNIVISDQLLMSTGKFDIGANSLSGSADLITNGGDLIIGTIGALVPELTGSYTLTSGIIEFNAPGPQTIRSTSSSPAITKYKTVEFSGSGTKSLSGPIVVDTDLQISGGTTLDVTASNFGITIAGDWTNTGTFNPRTGTVTFGGTASLKITNPAGAIYYNLTINNSAASSAVILKDPVKVYGLLTFIDGHVISTDTSMLSLGASAAVASASDASHVVGPVAKIVDSFLVFSFPTGNGTNYMPASISPTSVDSTTFVAQYFSLEQSVGTTEAGIDHVSAQDYWTIQRTSGTADAAVTLVWEYASLAEAEIDNLADLLVAQWDGSNWTSQGNAGTTGNFVTGSVKSNVITSFTQPYFVIGSSTENNPLSNWRYFAPLTGNWNDPGVWSYRADGPTTAPEPTSSKLVVIQPGNTVTILDSPSAQATKSMRSLKIFGTVVLGNSASQDVILNVGDRGLILGNSANIIGSDNNDQIRMSGPITLNNTTAISHTLLETNFVTQGNTIAGSGGKLPILNVNQSGQIFTDTTSFATLTVGSTATNNGTIVVTGSFSGNGLTNGATGTVVWQGTSISGNGINATTPGNTIHLVNNTGASIDIDQFATGGIFENLILEGANSFTEGSDTDIKGDFIIRAGGVVNITSGNHNLNLFGNWINDGTFNATSGTVVFNDTTTINGASTNNFNHILINGAVTPPAIFNVRGNFTNNGSLAAGGSTVAFNGTATQSISGTVITTFNNINLTNPTTIVQVQSDQYMTGALTLSANAKFDADGSGNDKVFTLLSTADDSTADASIAELPPGASVTGQVTVQRYVSVEGSSGRLYRYISSPVQNAPVSQIQAFIPITGTFAGASSCSGCGTNQSMFLYDETVITDTNGNGANDSNDGYLDFPATSNSETFSPGEGYAIYVRGNVAPILGFDSVVYSLRGPINSGDIDLPVSFTSTGVDSNDGWNLVGNPYPSTIDWDAAGWTRTNLDNTTYMLDNGLASPVYATHVAGGASTNGGSRYIASGQAFFVKGSSGSAALHATESVKAAGTQTIYLRTQTIQDIIRVTLRQGARADETVIQFKSGATTDFDTKTDARKLDNPAPMYSLATITSGLRYVINALPVPTDTTEVPLDIAYTVAGDYSLQFTQFESFADHGMTITLRDDFLGTSTNIRENPNYPFQVTSDAKSAGNTRFTIVFKATVVTEVHAPEAPFISIYPNATKNYVNVEVRSTNEVNAKVISLMGTTLFEKNLEGGQVKKGSFTLEDQADGMYILLIEDGPKVYQRKIVKKG